MDPQELLPPESYRSHFFGVRMDPDYRGRLKTQCLSPAQGFTLTLLIARLRTFPDVTESSDGVIKKIELLNTVLLSPSSQAGIAASELAPLEVRYRVDGDWVFIMDVIPREPAAVIVADADFAQCLFEWMKWDHRPL
jgi:hypothetical protein